MLLGFIFFFNEIVCSLLKNWWQSARELREPTWGGCKGLPQAHDSQPFQHLPKKLWASPDTAPTSYEERKYRKIRLQGNIWQRKYILSC